MNQRGPASLLLELSFYLHICLCLGIVDLMINDPQYALPFNSGWILISGLLTIISTLENK